MDGKSPPGIVSLFVNPVGSQKTADFLNMSLQYLYMLSFGSTQRVAEIMWGWELG
ncbi:MAG: hypothetical protein IPH31_05630 [Lewinellaceae bacterium]|nr:hypothetical protein [Lewinellaceae bacterium]